jgi:glycosyltransferase involved in cell wall biosynthesis/SAM-dependent methyltransferase
MHAVTIAARNYLAMARTLSRSYKEHNPTHDMTILVVDAEPGEISPTADFQIATPADLNLSDEEFGRMAFLYDVTELSTALKPWALEMLLDRGTDVAVYLDPDIFVYDSLDEIERLCLADGIVLTPHTCQPMPRDGMRPTEADIMGSGTFNLGFIAVRKNERDMLEWWQARLRRDSISAPEQMLFTDQRWIDLVPSYYKHHVLRDPGYNVAYWNLDQREITETDGKYFIGVEPLRFFHFSGYRPETPWILSKYVADHPRVVLSEHPSARRLCDAYAAAISAAGSELSAAVPYRFNRLRDGTRITGPMRRIYRNAVIEAERLHTAYPPAPSEADTDAAIRGWFTEPLRHSNQVNRLVLGVWEQRPDLRAAFPDPFGAHAAMLLDWCFSEGIKDKQTVASLLPSVTGNENLPARRLENNDVAGVNVAGYFQAEMGVGQIGRLLVEAVRASGLPYSTLRSTQTVHRQNAGFDDKTDAVRYRINIASVNADLFPSWVHDVGDDLLRDRYTIGVWAWEIEDFPDEYAHSLTLVNEIWAISSFVQKAIQRKTTKPVYVIPYQIGEFTSSVPLDRESFGISEGPYFLFMFDYLSVFERKNPLGLVAAFKQAFPKVGEASLVIKAMNGERFRSQREKLRHAAAGRPDIHLIDDYLDRDVVTALSANAVAYISLHRAEGLGLTLSEAMSAGRPVIATGYSGNLDFMTDDTSILIPYRMVDIPADAKPYPQSCQWAEPDLDEAAKAMRWVIENPADADELGRRGQDHARSTGSLDRTVDFITGRVTEIYAGLNNPAPPATTPSEPPAPAALTSLVQRIRPLLDSPPNVASASRFPRISKRIRQLTYRVLAHHDERVNEQLYALTSAVEAVDSVSTALGNRISSIDTRLASASDTERRIQRLSIGTDSLTEQVAELSGQAGDLRTGLAAQNDRIDTLSDIADRHGLQLQIEQERVETLAQSAPRVEATVRSHGAQFYDVTARLSELSAQLTQLDIEQSADPYRADPDALRITNADGRQSMGYIDQDGGASADYADFEDIYRGSSDFISARMQAYVDEVRGHDPVLDVGCGRGEFLALLRAAGIAAVGVDGAESMVQRSKSLDLDVQQDDAAAFLESADDASFGAITSFQFVEHVPPAEVSRIFRASFRALKPGGIMIAETVNPHSPAALKTFWLDVTHVRPLFPESLLFLARECGFSTGRIVFPHTPGDLAHQLRYSGEYALLARKPEHD